MKAFGDLEDKIMRVLWRRGPSTVRQVHDELARERKLAYTTVMTVMERLWRKDVLHRELSNRAFKYTPTKSEAEYTARLMHELLSTTSDRRTALAHFVRGMRKLEEGELLRLADEAARRRRTG